MAAAVVPLLLIAAAGTVTAIGRNIDDVSPTAADAVAQGAERVTAAVRSVGEGLREQVAADAANVPPPPDAPAPPADQDPPPPAAPVAAAEPAPQIAEPWHADADADDHDRGYARYDDYEFDDDDRHAHYGGGRGRGEFAQDWALLLVVIAASVAGAFG